MREILAGIYPELVAEWHPTKNGLLTPQSVSKGSKQKIWWQCQKDTAHVWQAAVYSRTKGSGCPSCSGRVPTLTNSFEICYPLLATEWHPTKNDELTPDQVKPHSDKKVWWQCSKDSSHEWPAAVKDRVHGNGCPFCRGRVPTATTCLSVIHPQLALEWHPVLNGPLTPSGVVPGSHQKVWWCCSKDPSHSWESVIYNRVKGNGCPYCAGKKATSTTSLSALYTSLAEEWHPIRNGELTTVDVRPGSHQKVWWCCSKDSSHEWEAVIKDRVSGKGCPICTGRKVIATTSLEALYPFLAHEWHPIKNGELVPVDVVPGSNKRVWWRCLKDPTHEWEAVIANRVSGTGCPACSNLQVTLTNSLAALYPHLACDWHPIKNGELMPVDVVPGSGKKAWWRCSKDSSHEWEATIASRVRGTGCPVCSGRNVTPNTSLDVLYPELAREWHPTKNRILTPQDVKPGSGKKVWWRCSADPAHEWEAVIVSRTSGRGCPYCRKLMGSSIEEIFALLLDEHGVNYVRQKEIGHYHVDFFLSETNSVVEVQGCYWHGCLQCGHDDAFHRTRRRQDAGRHTYLRKKGYQVELIWEHEFQQGAATIHTMILAKWKKDGSSV